MRGRGKPRKSAALLSRACRFRGRKIYFSSISQPCRHKPLGLCAASAGTLMRGLAWAHASHIHTRCGTSSTLLWQHSLHTRCDHSNARIVAAWGGERAPSHRLAWHSPLHQTTLLIGAQKSRMRLHMPSGLSHACCPLSRTLGTPAAAQTPKLRSCTPPDSCPLAAHAHKSLAAISAKSHSPHPNPHKTDARVRPLHPQAAVAPSRDQSL